MLVALKISGGILCQHNSCVRENLCILIAIGAEDLNKRTLNDVYLYTQLCLEQVQARSVSGQVWHKYFKY